MTEPTSGDEGGHGAGLLAPLGSSADEVAESLRRHGVRGVRNTVRFLNPVVRYARTRLPDARDLDVIGGEALRIALPNGTRREEPLPAGVRAFLGAFDRGAYPDLALPPECAEHPPPP